MVAEIDAKPGPCLVTEQDGEHEGKPDRRRLLEPRSFDSTFQRSAPARNGGTLSIDLRTGGRVRITGWDKPEASLQASLGGPDWRTTAVTFDAVDGGVRLESRDTGRSSSSEL